MSSPSFHKNVSIFQDLVNNLGIDSAAVVSFLSSDPEGLYGVDISDLQVDNSSLDSGVKSYVSRIEKWAKDKLEEEKRE